MRRIISIFSPARFPIWSRIMTGMILMILVPTFLSIYFIEQEVRATDFENLQAYVLERGTQQRDSVTDNFSRTRSELRTMAESDTQRGFLLRLLGFSSTVPDVLNSLQSYMNDRLIASGLFNAVRLVNNDGIVQLSADAGVLDQTASEVAVGDDERGTAAFRAYQTAIDLGETQRWALTTDSETGIIQIELIHIVRNVDGPVGYIAGRINTGAVILDALVQTGVFVQTESYLVTANRDVVTQETAIDAARVSTASAPVEQALAQRSGLERYIIDETEMLGYYAPIFDTPFAIIVEAPATVSFVATIDRVYTLLFPLVAALIVVAVIVALIVSRTVNSGLQMLQDDMTAMIEGDLNRTINAASRGDEVGVLARTFDTLREQTRSVIEDQASRINARVRDLQATQEVSRFAASQRDLQNLMDRVVDLIAESFSNIYHAQIFLIDSDRRYAVLRSSTGEPGRQLLARGHRLGIGSVSVIGQVTEEGRTVVARDTVDSNVHRKNEFLPETRSELAIPLRIGDEIMGALDVQSKQSGTFTDDQISILQTMADQIAVAIENTRLYQESMRRLEELEFVNRESTRFAWQEFLNYERQRRIERQAGTYTLTEDHDAIRNMAIQRGEPVVGTVTERNTIPFAVPIILRDQVLGAAEWELPLVEYSNDKVQLAQELVNRLALSLDNARLFQASQRATSRERLVNEIAAKLTGQTDIDEILQTAVREVGQALRAPQVQINLSLKPSGKPNGSSS